METDLSVSPAGWVTWSTVSPVQPRIKATIQNGGWRMITETGVDARLSVLESSVLILTCLSSYPIIWSKDNQEVPTQVRSCYPFAKDEKKYCEPDDRKYFQTELDFPLMQRFKAVIIFRNTTTENVGAYTCTNFATLNNDLSTTIRLDVHPMLNFSDRPQILQTGFDNLLAKLSACHSDPVWQSIQIPFIYTTPIDVEINQTLINPRGITLFPLESDVEDYQHFTTQIEKLSSFLSQTIFTIFNPVDWDVGDYSFSVQSRFRNDSLPADMVQSVIVQNLPFSIEVKHSLERSVWAQSVDSLQAIVDREIGTVIDIVMCSRQSSTLKSVRVVSTQIDQSDNPRQCKHENVPLISGREKCGIIGVTRFEASVAGELESEIHIFLNATNSCRLTVLTIGQDRQTEQEASLAIRSLTTEEIDFEKPFTLLTNGLLATIPPQPRDGLDYFFVNDTLTLRCIVPLCYSSKIEWCYGLLEKNETCIPAENGTIEEDAKNIFNDPTIIFASHLVSPYTIEYNMIFESLKTSHTDIYKCVMRPTLSNADIVDEVQGRSQTIGVSVKEPLAPTFEDGKKFELYETTITKGEILALSCQCDGRPRPEITWWSSELGAIEPKEPEDTQELPDVSPSPDPSIHILEKRDHPYPYYKVEDLYHNHYPILRPYEKTVLEVNNFGIYKCNATNRFGVNGRTFAVYYEGSNFTKRFRVSLAPTPEEHESLYFIIVAPLVVVLVLIISLLTWWLKRRLVQVPISNSAGATSSRGIPYNTTKFSESTHPVAAPLANEASDTNYLALSMEVPVQDVPVQANNGDHFLTGGGKNEFELQDMTKAIPQKA